MVLRAAVRGLDTLLRLRYGVHEFSRSPGCIFRVGPAHSPADMPLADGKVVRRGEPIADLHFWNEHIPPLPPEGADMRWAVGFYRLMRSSLQELADYLETEPRYRTAAAVRAVGSVMAKAPGRSSAAGGAPSPSAPLEEFAARLKKPSHTSVDVGKPASSHTALARNTAGVQLPQQPMPEMAASTPISLKRRGSAATTSRSSPPWVLPNSRQLTNFTPGNRALSASSRCA